MGDAENMFPSSKKRAAGREFSRENLGLDDEEEFPDQETGTFKKASNEVLANRRIVKVKRGQTSSTASAPSSNPFAAVRLVPPANATHAFVPLINSQEIVNHASEKLVVGNDENTPAAEEGKNRNEDKLKGNGGNAPASEEEKNGNGDKLERNDGNTPAPEEEKKETRISWREMTEIPLHLRKRTVKIEGMKTIPSFKQEVQVETGEENEKAVFTADSALFEFVDGGWKEHGKGELKVNVLTSTTRKARLVMRARGNYRLILNASIFPDMKLTNMEKKGITFACLNSTGEGQNGLSTFALKFRDASLIDEFHSVVMAHKGNLAPAVDLKIPETSPKAPEQ